MVEKFKETKAKVVFAAENFCWPDNELRPKYPLVDGDVQRFLNSGMFMGYAKNLFNVLSFADVKDDDDDQLFYTNVFLDEKMRNENSIKLDHKSSLFQNLNGNIGECNGRVKYLNLKFPL
jgi:procollagen-lysine,2-oxoglutarate 5-dioxygenase